MSVRVLDAVFRGSAAKGSARLVLLALADVAGDEGEVTAYRRSYSILQAKAAVSKSAVIRAIDTLVELGEIEVIREGSGRQQADYRINVERLRAAEGLQDDTPQVGTPGVAASDPRGSDVAPLGSPEATPITPSLSVPIPSSSTSRAEAVVAAGFEAFWTAYPNSAAKGAARKAWPAALAAAGSIELICAGATRYAQDPNRDPSYTKHASTWLRAECWNDPLLPPRKGAPATMVRRGEAPTDHLPTGRVSRDEIRKAAAGG